MPKIKAKPLCTLGEAIYTIERHREEFCGLMMLESAVQIAELQPNSTKKDVVKIVLDYIQTYKTAMEPKEKYNAED